ncbi:acyl-CoA thioesterase [Nesterenkonia sandarakina]|uniref:Acyl-CoA thioester hydrolase n=1 Tax=Nesterenkonia sandarakina TaxID=272918 RepID=A0A7Z0EAN4_9MICC|nr:acyl-CoA thioesterase [Nesterenkonia sandarakina]NYJ17986.1 acyl-CoA thioester hydrolase [Nesterenkonia sandarakina]
MAESPLTTNAPPEPAGARADPSGVRLRTQVPLRWGDMDAYGHINNVEVLRLLEEARIRAFGAPAHTGSPVGEPLAPLFNELPRHAQALVIEHRVRYLASLEYRDVPAQIDVWVTQLKGAGLTLAYEIRDGVDGTRCVIAETQLAFFDTEAHRLLRLSTQQREQAAAHQGQSPFRGA